MLEGFVGPNDNLGNIMQGRDPSELRAQIELDDEYYKYLDVQVVCTTDFERDPVDLVKAHIEYRSQGGLGDVHEIKDFVFKKDSAPGSLSRLPGR